MLYSIALSLSYTQKFVPLTPLPLCCPTDTFSLFCVCESASLLLYSSTVGPHGAVPAAKRFHSSRSMWKRWKVTLHSSSSVSPWTATVRLGCARYATTAHSGRRWSLTRHKTKLSARPTASQAFHGSSMWLPTDRSSMLTPSAQATTTSWKESKIHNTKFIISIDLLLPSLSVT